MSAGKVALATISIGMGEYDRAIEELKNENKNRPKVLSMLGSAYFFKGRIWEAYEIYNKLYHDENVYVHEMGVPREEYDPLARAILDCMEKAQIPAVCQLLKPNSALCYNEKQSSYSENSNFKEEDEFDAIASKAFELANGNFEQTMKHLKEFVEARRSLGGAHNEAMAAFFEGCVCELTERKNDAMNCYLRAASIEPEKAIYYAKAGMIIYDDALKDNLIDVLLATLLFQRAIDLDYNNPFWHYNLASDLAVLAKLFGSNEQENPKFIISSKKEILIARNLCMENHKKLYEACNEFLLMLESK